VSSARQGTRSYHLLLKLEGTPIETEKELERFFLSKSYVRYFERCRGYYDYRVIVTASDNKEISVVFDDLNEKFSGIIRERELIIPIRPLRYRIYPFLVKVDYKRKSTKPSKPMELDVLDEKLLTLVRNDARITFMDMGDKLGVSPETARYRFNRLQEGGILKDFSVDLNLGKLGYFEYTIFMKVDGYSRAMDDLIIERFYKEPSLLSVTRVVGKFDLIFEIVCKDPLEFDQQLTRLRKFFKDSIRFYEFTLKLETKAK